MRRPEPVLNSSSAPLVAPMVDVPLLPTLVVDDRSMSISLKLPLPIPLRFRVITDGTSPPSATFPPSTLSNVPFLALYLTITPVNSRPVVSKPSSVVPVPVFTRLSSVGAFALLESFSPYIISLIVHVTASTGGVASGFAGVTS